MGLGGPMQTGVRHQPEGKSVGESGKEGDMKREIGRVRDIEAERESDDSTMWRPHRIETGSVKSLVRGIMVQSNKHWEGQKQDSLYNLEQIQCTSDKPVYKSATTWTAVISVVWLTRDEAGYPGFHKAGKVQPQIWLFFGCINNIQHLCLLQTSTNVFQSDLMWKYLFHVWLCVINTFKS